MSDFEKKPYIQDRWISNHPDNFYIITPREFHSATPLSCPICETLRRSKDDEGSWDEFNSCYKCSLVWAAPRREKWKAGWRPTKEQIFDEISQRPPLSIKFVID